MENSNIIDKYQRHYQNNKRHSRDLLSGIHSQLLSSKLTAQSFPRPSLCHAKIDKFVIPWDHDPSFQRSFIGNPLAASIFKAHSPIIPDTQLCES